MKALQEGPSDHHLKAMILMDENEKASAAKPKSFWRRLLYWLAVTVIILFLFTLVQVGALRFINPPFTAFMFHDYALADHPVNMKLNWVPLKDISPHMAKAVLAAEDQRFYDHQGFDWVEIRKAWEDMQEGERFRGASTITMQTARNMFLWRNRDWIRKGLEAYYTALLELMLSKNRILEIYLNTVELGPGLYGAPAAAQKYFGRSVGRLSRDQSARLAYVLPSPQTRSPLKHTKYLAERRRFILNQMKNIELRNWPQ